MVAQTAGWMGNCSAEKTAGQMAGRMVHNWAAHWVGWSVLQLARRSADSKAVVKAARKVHTKGDQWVGLMVAWRAGPWGDLLAASTAVQTVVWRVGPTAGYLAAETAVLTGAWWAGLSVALSVFCSVGRMAARSAASTDVRSVPLMEKTSAEWWERRWADKRAAPTDRRSAARLVGK